MILNKFAWFPLERGDGDKLHFQRSTLSLEKYSHPGPPPLAPQPSYIMLKTCGLDLDIAVGLDVPTGLGHVHKVSLLPDKDLLRLRRKLEFG